MNRMPKRNNNGDEGESLVVPSSSTESDSLHNDDYVSDSDSNNSRNGGGSNENLPKVYRRRGKGEDGNKERQSIDDTCEDESLITYIRKKKVPNPPLSNGHTDKKMKPGNKAKSNGKSNQVQGEGKVAKKAKNKEDNGKQKSTHGGGKSASKAKSNGDEKRMNKREHKDDEEKVAKSNGQKKKIKRDKDNHKTNSDNQSEEKRSKAKKKREDVEEEEEQDDGALYQFPHNRIHRIIKDENVDSRLTQEAIFVINKATEKFLEVFCREAYACAFLDRNNYVGYDHLSSVVSKRQRFDFLSDFVPPKVRAEDALTEISKAEET